MTGRDALPTDDPRFPAPVARVRRRVLALALLVATVATLPTAVLELGEPAGGFALAMLLVLVAMLVVLATRAVAQATVERALIAATFLPTLAWGLHAVATRSLGDPDATLFALLLLTTQIGLGLAAGLAFVLPPRPSLWVGLLTHVVATSSVPALRPELFTSRARVGEWLSAVVIGAIVVLFLHLLSRTTAGLSLTARAAEDALEQRRSVQAMAAHDLRSPLAIATTALETLTQRGDRLALEQLQDIARVADLAVRRATALSDDLLDESLVLVTDLTHEPVVLADVVATAVATSMVDASEVTVVGCAMTVTTVPGRLERILVNLLDNADKHGAPPIIVRGWRSEDTWHVAVEDAGPGLGQRLRNRAFAPLERGEDAVAVQGQGLGLHIVQAFAGSLGGEVHAEPLPSGGARFVLTLPD